MLSGSSIVRSARRFCAIAAIAGFVPRWLSKAWREKAQAACANGMPQRMRARTALQPGSRRCVRQGLDRARARFWSALFFFLVARFGRLPGLPRAGRSWPLSIRRRLMRCDRRRSGAALPTLRRSGALRFVATDGAATGWRWTRRWLGAGMLRRVSRLLGAPARRLRSIVLGTRCGWLGWLCRRRAGRVFLRQIGRRQRCASAFVRLAWPSRRLAGFLLARGRIRLDFPGFAPARLR